MIFAVSIVAIIAVALFFIPLGIWIYFEKQSDVIQFHVAIFHPQFKVYRSGRSFAFLEYLIRKWGPDSKQESKIEEAIHSPPDFKIDEISNLPSSNNSHVELIKPVLFENDQSKKIPQKSKWVLWCKAQKEKLFSKIKDAFVSFSKRWVQIFFKWIRRWRVLRSLLIYCIRLARLSLSIPIIKIKNGVIFFGVWDASTLGKSIGYWNVLKRLLGLKNIELEPQFGKECFDLKGDFFLGLSLYRLSRFFIIALIKAPFRIWISEWKWAQKEYKESCN